MTVTDKDWKNFLHDPRQDETDAVMYKSVKCVYSKKKPVYKSL